MEAKLYNIATNLNSQDRILYNDETARDNDFSGRSSITRRATTFLRVDDLTFKIVLYLNDTDIMSDIIGKYNYIKYQGYYAFISSIIEKVLDQQVTITCSLDSITTYMTKNNIDVNKEIFIRRTHLDRFKPDVVGVTYFFDFDNDNLLIKEDFNVVPSVIDEVPVLYKEVRNILEDASGFDINSIKWLAITKTGAGDKISYRQTAFSTFTLELPNRTFYIPLVSANVIITDSISTPTFSITANIGVIMGAIETTDILDAKIIPYLGTETNWSLERNGGNVYLIISDVSNAVEFDAGTIPSTMFSNVNHGRLEELVAVDPTNKLDSHKPLILKSEILADNIEPKLFQFKKYIMNYLQESTELFFDVLKGEDIEIFLQRAIDYSTGRSDFYVIAGLFKDAKNTGATLLCIHDNTIATNVDQFAEYQLQKKATGSSGYAYGGAVAKTGLALGLAGLTGGLSLVAGAGQIGSGVSSVVQTYKERQDLKQAPDNIKSRGSNILNDIATEEAFGLTLTISELLQSEIKMIKNFLYQNGYKFEQHAKLIDIIDSRLVFNFIQALTSDKVLSIGISDMITGDINNRLNIGVRFYKSLDLLDSKPDINNERNV